ncbi:NAD(P)/FAD-dependent oxidoreductase [Chitinophaga rhizophila]|uniref:NADH:ubiquinone reductase (non-electrogenic) n=1 Tax=Chitinophaga rhizophila TaxID=2866212 RepID=A0ABS7G7L5_9BACT|nr:NAD(P)/FAD-dependent oxidoreductase [Chitinophaga rhizophila]MBW8682784.1 NAD(P)/FAD-dependent oxidoreductase [Chitinophaga rhizophila]
MESSETKGQAIKVVIIGGGFAGINLARKLQRDKRFRITLVDKNNYNYFPPLIYQLATGFLETSSICYPFRKLFRDKPNLNFHMGEFQRVDPVTRSVFLNNGELQYDYLVFATGTETNYFGNENIKKDAIPMKTVNDALEMRNRLLKRLEVASITKDPIERKKLTTVVIAGGGPTGVEVSGMLAELRKYVIRKDYPELEGQGGEIYLVNGGESLLEPMSPKSQKHTFDALRRLGVKIKLKTRVKDFVDDQVILNNGETIQTKTLIWAAGVTASLHEGIPIASTGPGRRMMTDAFNRVIGVDDIYAIGDTCLTKTDKNFPEGHPQLAQVALQQGRNLAKNFSLMVDDKPLRPFSYVDRGSMAIIGRNNAVADIPSPKLHFNGFIAWVMWLFIHVMALINYRNKLKTIYNWTVAYFTRDQALRMIIKPILRQPDVKPEPKAVEPVAVKSST